MDLSGEWAFRLDTGDLGEAGLWWADTFDQTIRLPGSLQEQGYGYEPLADFDYTGSSPAIPIWRESPVFAPYRDSGKVKLSWALTPRRIYVGPAWYKKRVRITPAWAGRPLRLLFERPHWTSDLWVDGQYIGQQNSLCVPHVFELDSLSEGYHELVLKVDNRMHEEVGPNAHSISDQTQTNWNGVIGRMEMETLPAVEIRGLDIYPDFPARTLEVRVSLRGHLMPEGKAVLRIWVRDRARYWHKLPAREYPVDWVNGTGIAVIKYPLGDQVAGWDEFHPQVYQLEAALVEDGETIDRTSQAFGLRELEISDKRFLINGRKIFIRSTLENAQYPQTGYPPMDVESWKSRIETARSYGLNHFRFHSWCPPEAAFTAADEMGFYLQVEGPTWPERVDPGTPIADFLFRETERILAFYGNHPSFIMFSCGNEFGGSNAGMSYYPDSLLDYQLPPPAQVQQCLGAAFLGSWTDHFKRQAEGRQWFTGSSGWPYIEENDYHIMHEPFRMRNVFDRLPPNTRIAYQNLVETHDVPLVSHETGQWCAYPDLSAAANYNGFLRAGNLEIWRDFAQANGVLDYAGRYHDASGRWQVLLYKQELEALLRTPGAGGFNLLGLTDYHGHGFAPVGLLDAFWNAKSYVYPSIFRHFCAPVVPLAKMDKRVWLSSETFEAEIQLAQFDEQDLRNIPVQWEIRDGAGKPVDRGGFAGREWPQGECVDVGRITADLGRVRKADKLTLYVSLRASPWQNSWDFWVYPAAPDRPDTGDLLISRDLDSGTVAAIEDGRKILFVPDPSNVRAVNPGRFESIFWSTWSGTGTLGLLCRSNHPALKDFPTDEHTDWQWWELLRTSLPLDLTPSGTLDEPIVQVIDNWVRAHELGLLFEFRIGESRILVCAMDIVNDLEQRVVARQLRHSLVRYMNREAFSPGPQISLEDFRMILGEQDSGLLALGASVWGSQDVSPNRAENLIDGDTDTYWEAGTETEPPYEVVLELPGYLFASGLRLVPYRNGPDLPVVDYRVFVSHDGADWGEPVGAGLYPPVGKSHETIAFQDERNVRFAKIQFHENAEFPIPYVSLAEIELITETKSNP